MSNIPARAWRGHRSSITDIKFSPDGSTIATSSHDHTVKLWEAKTGKLVRTLAGHWWYVMSIVFSPDGAALVSGSYDRTIKIWDIHTGAVLRTLEGHNTGIRCIALSPDGKTVASGTGSDGLQSENITRTWDMRTGEKLLILPHDGEVDRVAFSPDGTSIATLSREISHLSYLGIKQSRIFKRIKLWNATSGAETWTVEEPDGGNSLAFSPDGNLLITCVDIPTVITDQSGTHSSNADVIKFWDTRTGVCTRTLSCSPLSVRSSVLTSDMTSLVAGSPFPMVTLWDVREYFCLFEGSIMRQIPGAGQVDVDRVDLVVLNIAAGTIFNVDREAIKVSEDHSYRNASSSRKTGLIPSQAIKER